jgi:hypothetical protein
MPSAEVIAGGEPGDFALVRHVPQYTPEEIVTRHASIRFANHEVPIRTLWHVLYEPATASMTVSFHVRDSEAGEVRSPQLRFSLSPAVPAQPAPPLTVP